MDFHIFTIIITGFLIILWVYTTLSKVLEFKKFKHAMSIQVFPKWVGEILVYILPFSEICLVILLILPSFRLIGMYSSLFMMFIFTLYVGGAVFKIYERTPCACGGLFARLNWTRHFKVNISLTIIALIGVLLVENTI